MSGVVQRRSPGVWSSLPRWVVAFLAVVAVVVVAGGGFLAGHLTAPGPESGRSYARPASDPMSVATTITVTETVTPTSEAAPGAQAGLRTGFDEGVYEGGVDVQPGRYKSPGQLPGAATARGSCAPWTTTRPTAASRPDPRS